MRAIDHSSLIKVLDEKVESGWYVTEYYPGGTLGDRLEQFKGHVLDSLLAFRRSSLNFPVKSPYGSPRSVKLLIPPTCLAGEARCEAPRLS